MKRNAKILMQLDLQARLENHVIAHNWKRYKDTRYDNKSRMKRVILYN